VELGNELPGKERLGNEQPGEELPGGEVRLLKNVKPILRGCGPISWA